MVMHRSFPAAVIAASLACAAPALCRAGTPESTARARALLDRNEPKPAAELLESALGSATPTDRAGLLELLHRAYDSAARQAEAAGKADEAELYRENLAILDRKPRHRAAPPALTALPRSPAAAAPAPEQPAPETEQPRAPAEAPPVAQAPRDPGVARNAAVTNAPNQPAPAPMAADDVRRRIAQANDAFRGQSYEEAGRLYTALAREDRLPKELFNHLAYCRCVAVVKRINAQPASAEEWAQINAEIDRIQQLSPKLWYTDYLRNLAAERSKGPNRSRSNKVVVRGAAPEEPADAYAPPGAAAGRGPAPAQPAAEAGRWQVHETASFRIFHADPNLAQRVGEIAERARREQTARWTGAAPRGPWTPKCDVYVYPTAKIFSAMTGQPEDSPGFSTMGLDSGRINCRRVNLRADHPKITDAILPHEVTHVVLADLFPHKQIPRWADEGMAVLAEPRTEQRLRAADLDAPLTSGRLFRMGDLMVMDYPHAQHWGLYYAQSVSLTRFLVESGTPTQFIEFVQGCQQGSHEDVLRRVYKIDGFVELQRRWLAFARNQTATADNAKKDGETASR
jgi:hypothetical protein